MPVRYFTLPPSRGWSPAIDIQLDASPDKRKFKLWIASDRNVQTYQRDVSLIFPLDVQQVNTLYQPFWLDVVIISLSSMVIPEGIYIRLMGEGARQ